MNTSDLTLRVQKLKETEEKCKVAKIESESNIKRLTEELESDIAKLREFGYDSVETAKANIDEEYKKLAETISSIETEAASIGISGGMM